MTSKENQAQIDACRARFAAEDAARRETEESTPIPWIDGQDQEPGQDVLEPPNQEDAAYCHLGDAMKSVLLALQSTLDEPVMQQLAPLLYQIRRVQAKLELP